ncbi:Cell cycle control protein [Legionella massiliensis]|uniref:Cell cycle control protein n=1 Tax=Legionella massiliensis TaxID=1034943 RepID=A0A078KZJ8_9GAMM|nr:F-box protein [Legionella massiliensis]CDZ78351.1 Cell cycle control protein [Legionella massiliensis]CEE14089.1 Regulator of chromosome condensation (RCC1) repeat protein [Legionella massiliensis]
MSKIPSPNESIRDTLPVELLLQIFDSLPLSDIAKFRLLSKEVKAIVDDYFTRQLKIKEIACGQDHSLILLEKGRVLAMGSNEEGQLGLSDKTNHFVAKEIVNIEPIEHLSAGFSHTLMLSKNNTLWAMGSNADKQLSFANQGSKQVELQQFSTTRGIQAAIAVDFTSAYIDTDQVIHSCGHEGLKPHLINGELKLLPDWVKFPASLKVADIAVGKQHALLLTTEGEVYGIGSNEHGLLGLGSKITTCEDWTLLPINKARQIKATSLGSLVLTTNNELMVTGTDSKGQFKQSSSDFVTLATDVKTFDANDFHTLYVNNADKLHALGSNDKGQLGIGKLNPDGQPESALLLAVGDQATTEPPAAPQATSQTLSLYSMIFKSKKAPPKPTEEELLDWDSEDSLSQSF